MLTGMQTADNGPVDLPTRCGHALERVARREQHRVAACRRGTILGGDDTAAVGLLRLVVVVEDPMEVGPTGIRDEKLDIELRNRGAQRAPDDAVGRGLRLGELERFLQIGAVQPPLRRQARGALAARGAQGQHQRRADREEKIEGADHRDDHPGGSELVGDLLHIARNGTVRNGRLDARGEIPHDGECSALVGDDRGELDRNDGRARRHRGEPRDRRTQRCHRDSECAGLAGEAIAPEHDRQRRRLIDLRLREARTLGDIGGLEYHPADLDRVELGLDEELPTIQRDAQLLVLALHGQVDLLERPGSPSALRERLQHNE